MLFKVSTAGTALSINYRTDWNDNNLTDL